MISKPLIDVCNVDLEYDLHFDRTNTLKEWAINAITRKAYVEKKKDRLLALNDVSFRIHENERVGFIGFNGAGKSTLLKVISGILKPTRGSIKVHGAVQPLIEIGAGFDPEFSGRENIYFNSYMLGFTKKQVDAHLQEVIDFAELGEFIDIPVKYYSSGMQVRLAFTVATCVQPEILVLDEMLGAGDAAFVDKAKRRMNLLVEKAKGLVIVSHDLGLIESFCTRVFILQKGQLIFEGNAAAAVKEYKRMAGIL